MRKLLFIYSLLLCLFHHQELFATAQYGEMLFMDGRWYSMFSDPLSLSTERLDTLVQEKVNMEMSSSALWRGYIGYWSIVDKTLYLDSIHINHNYIDDTYETIIAKDSPLFTKYKDSHGISASWMNDTIRVISGKIVKYVHMGWESIYEHEQYFSLENGEITGRTNLEYRLITNGIYEGKNGKKFTNSIVNKFKDVQGSMTVQCDILEFSKKGKAKKVSVEILHTQNTIGKETKEQIEKAIADYMLSHNIVPVYQCNGVYQSDKQFVWLKFPEIIK